MKGKTRENIEKQSLGILTVIIVLAALTGITGATSEIEAGKFYAVEPAGSIERLIKIDPATAAVETVFQLSGETGFRSNSLAFSPTGELYGWDNPNNRLYKIDLGTGVVSYVGASSSLSPWVNGIAFDSSGDLYGLIGATDQLISINPTSGATSVIGPSYVNVKHNGLGVNFATDDIYSITGWADGMPDYLLKVNIDEQPVVNDDYLSSDGGYTWTIGDASACAGLCTHTWNQPAGIHEIRTNPSGGAGDHVELLKEVAIPSSGYAKIVFDRVQPGKWQNRIHFFIEEDENNYYRFILGNWEADAWSTVSNTVEKVVSGATTDINEGGHSLTANKEYVLEVWWSSTYMKMAVDGVTIKNIQTSDTTIIKPAKFKFRSYRMNTDLKSIEIWPGHVQIVGELGVDLGGVGTEFNPKNGKLYTIRNSNQLMTVNLATGFATPVGILGDSASTVNLASLWPDVTLPTTSTTIPPGGEEIPEFPTAALPAIIAAGGYLLMRKKREG